MKPEIKNIDELFLKVNSLQESLNNKSISVSDAAKEATGLKKILRSAIKNYDLPEGKLFFKNKKEQMSKGRANLEYDLLKAYTKTLQLQAQYQKLRKAGGKKIDFFESK